MTISKRPGDGAVQMGRTDQHDRACVIAAIASWSRGGRYVAAKHEATAAVPEAETAAVAEP